MQLAPSAYAILGLLSLRPMSGYDLALAAAGSIAHFWPMSKSGIYKELPRLEAEGLVEGTPVPQDDLPDKTTYALSPAGAAALDAWLAATDWPPERNKLPLLVKVFFAHRIGPGQTRTLLDAARARAEVERDHLQVIVDHLTGEADYHFARATALFGLRHAEATLTWIDELLDDAVTGRTPERFGRPAAMFDALPPWMETTAGSKGRSR